MFFQAKGLLSQPPSVEMTLFVCTNPNCRKAGRFLRQKQGRTCRKCNAPIEVTGTATVKNPRHESGASEEEAPCPGSGQTPRCAASDMRPLRKDGGCP